MGFGDRPKAKNYLDMIETEDNNDRVKRLNAKLLNLLLSLTQIIYICTCIYICVCV